MNGLCAYKGLTKIGDSVMRRLGYSCHTELWKRLGVQRPGRQIKEREGRKCNAGDQQADGSLG